MFDAEEGEEKGEDRGHGEQDETDGVAVGGGVVGRAHHQRWEESAESARGSDDAGHRPDAALGCLLRDPAEHRPRTETHTHCHQHEVDPGGDLQTGFGDHPDGEDGGAGARDGGDQSGAEAIRQDTTDRSRDDGRDGEAGGARARGLQVEVVDVLQVGRQICREGDEAAEGGRVEESHLPGDRKLRGGNEFGNHRIVVGVPHR